MPSYSDKSRMELETCHSDLQILFNYVVNHYDCSIIYGNRAKQLQFELFKKGRKQLEDGSWVIEDVKKVVTYKDGYNKSSKHNFYPSKAVDAVPFPIVWSDMRRMRMFVGFVLGVAQVLYDKGIIKHKIRSGADWDRDWDLDDQRFNDVAHFEIVE